MPRPIQVNKLDEHGYLGDLVDASFPPNAFIFAHNVRFVNGQVSRVLSRELVKSLSFVPYHCLFVAATPSYWVLAGQDKLYVWDGSVVTDVSKVGGYAADLTQLWTSDIFGGIPVLNNGINPPQCQISGTAAGQFSDFPAWPAGYTAKVVRGYKNYLIAYNVSHAGGNFPHLIKWSAPAAPGAMPANWDASDPTSDANEIELYDSWAGPIIDVLPLRDKNIVYKANSIWTMQTIPSAFVFDVERAIQGTGLLARNCVSAIANGAAHLFASHSDLLIYDGATVRSAITKKVRDRYMELRTLEHIKNSFMVSNPRYKETMFCYPTEGHRWPTEAMVLNEDTGAITLRSLPGVPHMSLGDWLAPTVTWDSLTQNWDALVESWDSSAVYQSGQDLHSVSAAQQGFYREDSQAPAATEVSTLIFAFALERSANGTPAIETAYYKTFFRAKFNIEGGPVVCRLGYKHSSADSITWGPKTIYDPVVNDWYDNIVTERLLFLEMTSLANNQFSLDSYSVMITRKGRF